MRSFLLCLKVGKEYLKAYFLGIHLFLAFSQ
ncbi:uncharacterized protein METZ01_LOCUS390670, partial [marine metagenome]